jgi:hypothetical protein
MNEKKRLLSLVEEVKTSNFIETSENMESNVQHVTCVTNYFHSAVQIMFEQIRQL